MPRRRGGFRVQGLEALNPIYPQIILISPYIILIVTPESSMSVGLRAYRQGLRIGLKNWSSGLRIIGLGRLFGIRVKGWQGLLRILSNMSYSLNS